MHQRDYSKPLEVVWMCVGCHGKFHEKARTARRMAYYAKRYPPRAPIDGCN